MIHFLCFFRSGPSLLELLERLVAGLSVEPRVVVVGPVPEPEVRAHRKDHEQNLLLHATESVEDAVMKHALERVLSVRRNAVTHRVLLLRGSPPAAVSHFS